MNYVEFRPNKKVIYLMIKARMLRLSMRAKQENKSNELILRRQVCLNLAIHDMRMSTLVLHTRTLTYQDIF